MSPRRIIFIVVALVASAMTVLLGRAWLDAGRHTQVAAPAPQAPAAKPAAMVLVARGNLTVGQFVRRENLRWQAWPEDSVPQSYISAGQYAIEDFDGAVVRTALGDGEPITQSRLVRPGDRGFLAAVLTPGYRAVTVNVSATTGVGNLVFPGDHIDLIATLKLTDDEKNEGGAGHEHHASETLLNDLRILALDQKADDQNKEPILAKTATLEVTPKQAEIIAVVAEIGKLSLSLRSLAHDEPQATAETGDGRLSYTLDSDATQIIRPPRLHGQTQQISVSRGDKISQVEFSRSAR